MTDKAAWYPLAFKPIVMPRVWGGRRLARLGRELPASTPCGESWELSDRPEAPSRVANGPLQGLSLAQLRRKLGAGLLGELPADQPFPLLVKFLDVKELLSIQVHPSDRLAPGQGKTEAWYFMEASPKARLYLGLRPGTRLEQVRRLAMEGGLERRLRSFRPAAGDAAWLPAGTVHAVGGGALIAEVQQNSDTTYRLYDWNRPGLDGKPRALHVDQALEVLSRTRPAPRLLRGVGQAKTPGLLASGPYFRLQVLPAPAVLRAPGRPQVLIGLSGRGRLVWPGGHTPLGTGSVLLLPAALGTARIQGGIRVLRAVPAGHH